MEKKMRRPRESLLRLPSSEVEVGCPRVHIKRPVSVQRYRFNHHLFPRRVLRHQLYQSRACSQLVWQHEPHHRILQLSSLLFKHQRLLLRSPSHRRAG